MLSNEKLSCSKNGCQFDEWDQFEPFLKSWKNFLFEMTNDYGSYVDASSALKKLFYNIVYDAGNSSSDREIFLQKLSQGLDDFPFGESPLAILDIKNSDDLERLSEHYKSLEIDPYRKTIFSDYNSFIVNVSRTVERLKFCMAIPDSVEYFGHFLTEMASLAIGGSMADISEEENGEKIRPLLPDEIELHKVFEDMFNQMIGVNDSGISLLEVASIFQDNKVNKGWNYEYSLNNNLKFPYTYGNHDEYHNNKKIWNSNFWGNLLSKNKDVIFKIMIRYRKPIKFQKKIVLPDNTPGLVILNCLHYNNILILVP